MLLTIEVIREGVLDILSDMERLDLIRVNSPAKTSGVHGEKLSQKFAGALNISDTTYEEFQKALQKSRSEWHKATC